MRLDGGFEYHIRIVTRLGDICKLCVTALLAQLASEGSRRLSEKVAEKCPSGC